MITEKIPQIEKLNSAEKLLLISELWEDLSRNPEQIPVPEETIKELDKRLEEFEQDPGQGKSWEEVKKGILEK
jgi:putative addiction module component (TIGR02574 family)